MTKLKCARCGTLNQPYFRYQECVGCGVLLHDAELVDV